MAVHKLVFDTTDATSIAASSNVGAYIRASDGTLLTHTDVGGKKALDVRVAEGINVEVDLSHVDDSVKVGDGTDFLEVNADGSINITDNGGSLTVDATQLDIDDLNATDDAVSAWLKDGTGNAISSTGGAIHISDAGGSLTVDATDLDIRDLTHVSDSVKIGDGTDFLEVNADGSINVQATQGAFSSLKNIAETVGTSVAAIVDGADELANRKELWLYNNGNKTTYVGESGITTSTGFPLPPGAILELRAGAAMDVYMIADAAGMNVRTLQFA